MLGQWILWFGIALIVVVLAFELRFVFTTWRRAERSEYYSLATILHSDETGKPIGKWCLAVVMIETDGIAVVPFLRGWRVYGAEHVSGTLRPPGLIRWSDIVSLEMPHRIDRHLVFGLNNEDQAYLCLAVPKPDPFLAQLRQRLEDQAPAPV